MDEFQREVAEVKWWLDHARPVIACDMAQSWFGDCVYRNRGEIVSFTDRQHAMLRRGDELWPARVRAASRMMRRNI